MSATTTSAPAPDPDQPDHRSKAAQSDRSAAKIPSYRVFESTAHLPEDQMLAIRWLHAHYYDANSSLAEIGGKIGYDGGTVSKVFHGKYEGDLAAVTKAITTFRRLIEERASVHRAPYIETGLYTEIEACCRAALTYQKIVYIYGESQVGKSAALRHYAAKHNHGETVLVEMPVGGAISGFLAVLAQRLRMNHAARQSLLALNIQRALTERNLLIVDEASRALQSRAYGGGQLRTMDFIRSLHDATGCGVVLCGTNVFRDQMADREMAKFLNQFNRRCLLRRQLPDVPARADLNKIAAHYELALAEGDALKLQREVVRGHGLGVWLTTLTAASRAAAKARQPMTWQHVVKAHAFLRQMEETRDTED